ncbi:MAG: sugar phosphate isomerase/epimerase family protein [Syntrophobacteraceae bacterium]
MKLSFSTNAFVRFTVTEAIAMIAGAGYSGVELLADAPHLFAFSTTDADLEGVAEALDRHNIRAANINANTAVGYYGRSFWEPLFEPSLANPDADARKWRIEYTKKCIGMASFLSCPSVSVTSGRTVPGVSPDRSLEYLKESLGEVLGYAAARGVRIGMEYEPGLLIERFGELEALIDALGAENFGANLDLGHSHVLGEDPLNVIEGLSSKVFHAHLEDIRAGKHYHLVPGDGDMDFAAIWRAFETISYAGFITVELYTYPDAPEQAAKRAFAYLDNLQSHRM